MFRPDPEPLELEILVVPDATLILVAAVIEPLRAANRVLGRRQYRWLITTPDGNPAMTTSGIPIPAERAFTPQGSGAPLLVIASYNPRLQATPSLIKRLSRAAAVRPMIGSVESGAWLLALAGLLNGRRATTHWEDLDDFAARFPEIDVRPDRFVIDGKRFTTGGASPALDMMLELIRARQGYPLALDVAKLFLYDQSHMAEEPQRTPSLGRLITREPRVAAAVKAMEEHIEEPLSIAQVAAAAGVSLRRLQTLFLETLKVAPHAYYHALRLNVARRTLIETRLSVAEIAAASGFNSGTVFTRAYRGQYGESPSETRRRARAA
jgi:transcriptional regulator GlxA family with amidase domain